MLTRRWFKKGDGKGAANGRFTSFARLVRTRPSAIDPLQSSDRPEPSFEAAWRRPFRSRLLIVVGLLAFWVVGIQARLAYLQVVKHDEYLAMAQNRQQMALRLEALRGDIVDRAGRMMAYSVEADSIAADPTKVGDKKATANAVCDALGDCSARERAELFKKLSSDKQFAQIRTSRTVSPEQVQRVADLRLPGIVMPAATRRYYPRAELGAHVLGFVDIDNKGQAGVEYVYNKLVQGQDGLAFAQVDARRQRLDFRVEREPVTGAKLELTLDLYLQHIAERELRAGVEANRARGGTAIVMDPHTGEILALASYPTFNPNAVGRHSADDRRNRATQDVYEPGSTFKVVTAAAALEEGVLTPHEMIDTSPGYISFPGRKAINDTHNYGVLSFEDVIVLSSNVGAIKAGLRVGPERLGRYVHRFGFGQALAPDFAGASRGIWNPTGLDASGLASVSMGYQISVTPLQMASAVSAVANGGLLMEPRIVRAITRDGRREVQHPKVLRRAIQPHIAATLTTIMEGVTERGTAKAGRLDRYQVAGKTGTARKIVDGRYSDSEYNASFVGFVPSRQPAFTILVVIDTPRAGTYYGGSVAAPIFKKIAEAALLQKGVAPTLNPETPMLVRRTPPSLPARPERQPIGVPMYAASGTTAAMPDLRGLSGREAVRVLSGFGLSARLKGSGFVVSQTPEPGQPVEQGGWSSVHLQRTAAVDPPPGAHE